jgi:hypothetical protein
MKKELAKSINWEVQERELILGSQINVEATADTVLDDNLMMNEVSGFKAIIGEGGKPIYMPKDGYTPLKNSQLMQAAEMMAAATNGTVEGFETFKGGRKVLAFVKAESNTSKINGNEINDYIVIGNSHDGSSSVFIGTSTVLLRCENQFSEIQRDFSIRHSGDMAMKFSEALEHYQKYYTARDKMYKKFEGMSNIQVSESGILSLTDKLFDIDREKIDSGEEELSTRKQNQLNDFQDSLDTELSDLGSNLWGVFNAVTHYTTHTRGKNGATYEASNSHLNVVGSNANFNTKAKRILTSAIAELA